jgi:hypothetical protein
VRRWLHLALVGAFGMLAGNLLTGRPVEAQNIKATDPRNGHTVDLGDWGGKLDTIAGDTTVMQTQLASILKRLNRPLVVIPQPLGACAATNTTLFDQAISQTATTRIITGVPGMRWVVCAIRIVANAAEVTSELEGTGTNCGTGTVAHSGSTTAASGESFSAGGGYQSTQPFYANKPGTDFCIGDSGSSRVTGKVTAAFVPS